MNIDAQHLLHISEVDFADRVQPGQPDIVDDAVEGIALRELSEGLTRRLAVIEVDRDKRAGEVGILTASDADDMVASGSEPVRERTADALACASNEKCPFGHSNFLSSLMVKSGVD
jgi:hypothetical protein